MNNNEPSLKAIDDYGTLKGSKKKVVWTVIIACLLIGVIYTVAKNYYGKSSDEIYVKEKIYSR